MMADNRNLKNPLAIIPARGGSKRFPRKNIALLDGKPLLVYAIEAALGAGIFADICVSSDDEEILSIAADYSGIILLKRPLELSGDTVTNYDVCRYLIDYFEGRGKSYDSFGHIWVTNPLRTAEDIRTGWEAFRKNDADFLMSMGAYPHPPQWACRIDNGLVERVFGDKFAKRGQELEQLYLHNSAFVFGRVDSFAKYGDWYKGKVQALPMPPERSVDIDHPRDLKWAEFLIKYNQNPQTAELIKKG